MVFIHGRLNDVEQALTLMVDRVGDVHQVCHHPSFVHATFSSSSSLRPLPRHRHRSHAKAVEFVRKQNEAEIWDLLILKSIRNPVFVSGLLENVGTHINPLSLVEKIPDGLEIIGLRDRLVKIINDYLLQKSLSEGCKEVLNADVIRLSRRLYQAKTRGVRIDFSNRCGVSNQPILNAAKKRPIVQFFCGHSYYRHELINEIKKNQAEYQQMNAVAQSPSRFYCPVCLQKNAKLGGSGNLS